MVRYFVLIKRKTAKKWSGVVPAKKGVSLSKLKSVIAKSLKSGYSAKIVSATQLAKILTKGKVRKRKTTTRRKTTRKTRKKTTRKTRRKR